MRLFFCPAPGSYVVISFERFRGLAVAQILLSALGGNARCLPPPLATAARPPCTDFVLLATDKVLLDTSVRHEIAMAMACNPTPRVHVLLDGGGPPLEVVLRQAEGFWHRGAEVGTLDLTAGALKSLARQQCLQRCGCGAPNHAHHFHRDARLLELPGVLANLLQLPKGAQLPPPLPPAGELLDGMLLAGEDGVLQAVFLSVALNLRVLPVSASIAEAQAAVEGARAIVVVLTARAWSSRGLAAAASHAALSGSRKKVVFVHELDSDFGGASFAEVMSRAPQDLRGPWDVAIEYERESGGDIALMLRKIRSRLEGQEEPAIAIPEATGPPGMGVLIYDVPRYAFSVAAVSAAALSFTARWLLTGKSPLFSEFEGEQLPAFEDWGRPITFFDVAAAHLHDAAPAVNAVILLSSIAWGAYFAFADVHVYGFCFCGEQKEHAHPCKFQRRIDDVFSLIFAVLLAALYSSFGPLEVPFDPGLLKPAPSTIQDEADFMARVNECPWFSSPGPFWVRNLISTACFSFIERWFWWRFFFTCGNTASRCISSKGRGRIDKLRALFRDFLLYLNVRGLFD
jgi:hypothetical protein